MTKRSSVRYYIGNYERDIPLSKAVVATKWHRRFPLRARIVTVFRHPMGTRGRDYDYTYGAGNEEFWLATPKERLRLLLEHKRFIIEELGVPEDIVHEALMVIPEYRREMQRVG